MEQIKQTSALYTAVSKEITNARTVCGICSGACGITLELENGAITAIEGDYTHPVSKGHLCPKCRAFPELLRSPDRLKHPLQKRVSGEWKQIAWDKAYGILAKQLTVIRQKYGPEAMALHVGHAGVGKEFPSYVERFCSLYGTPNFSTSGSHCYESKFMAGMITYGAMPIADYENSRCIVLWGKNPLSSTPSLVKSIAEAESRNCALVVIDPRATFLAGKATLHLQLRPGTDGALALGLLNIIIKEGLYDREFVRTWTVGFDKLVEHILEFTPEQVEKITWVPASKIRQAARIYALSTPACISMGVSIELATNGFQTARAIAILRAITGNLDVAGGSLFIKEPDLTQLKLKNSNNKKPAIGAYEYPLFHESSGHAQANLYSQAILEEKPYPLKGLVVAGSNPVLTWPNAGKVKEALSKLEFLAVMDPFMTETAKLADIVLPCATFLGSNELWDSSHLSSEPRLGLAPRLYSEESLPTNWEIWKELAERMGFRDYFPWDTEEDAISFRLRSLNITLADLKEMPAGHVYYSWSNRKYERGGFKTPSGKVEIYSALLEYHGYDPLPIYREPMESPLSTPEIAVLYPLVLTTGARTTGYLHSRFHNVPSLVKRVPEPFVEVNPMTAGSLYIEDGESVTIETLRGMIQVRTKCTDRILPGVISIPHGWDNANANILTDDANLDPVTGFPADRSLLARIAKRH